MQPVELTEVASTISRTWPNFRAPDGMLRAWERLLGDLDFRSVMAAVDDLALDGHEWAPPPGAIRRRCFELAGAMPPDADQAWAEVVEHIDHYWETKYDQSGTDSGRLPWTPIVREAVDGLGWWTLRESEQLSTDRAHFLRIYPAVVAREVRRVAAPPSVQALTSGPTRRELSAPNGSE